jgi:hypothetical protein
MIRRDVVVAVRFNGDPRYVAKRPETDRLKSRLGCVQLVGRRTDSRGGNHGGK